MKARNQAGAAPRRGVVYCVVDKLNHVERALLSISSLRRFYNGPITVFTNLPVTSFEDFAELDIQIYPRRINEDGDYRSRWIKLPLITLTPYDQTLYLDTDTVVVRPIRKIWNHLNNSDIAFALEQRDIKEAIKYVLQGYVKGPQLQNEIKLTKACCKLGDPYFNSGVVLWKNTRRVIELSKIWFSEWLNTKLLDQWPLVRAIAKSNIKPSILPNIYNDLRQGATAKTVILHGYSGRDIGYKGRKVKYHLIFEEYKHLIGIEDDKKKPSKKIAHGFSIPPEVEQPNWKIT